MLHAIASFILVPFSQVYKSKHLIQIECENCIHHLRQGGYVHRIIAFGLNW